ncbi:uncharacterized protein LOC123316571 [Coccinella septempunctata]|uniref:uncharacterized protein LOC123316571 n=1 Tax=Coccinella septempunctata TaxID=41139 RepID=UPI001D06E690|nr:uncharacterized protein LOC123316571 [Coccinella septempunctata]
MCDYDGGYYDGGGYTEDIVHHDVVHHDVVHHDVIHDYYPHHVDYCSPHVDIFTPGIGIGVGVGSYVGPMVTPVASYPAPVMGYPSGPAVGVGYVQSAPAPVVYTREPEVTCCATCTIL